MFWICVGRRKQRGEYSELSQPTEGGGQQDEGGGGRGWVSYQVGGGAEGEFKIYMAADS